MSSLINPNEVLAECYSDFFDESRVCCGVTYGDDIVITDAKMYLSGFRDERCDEECKLEESLGLS